MAASSKSQMKLLIEALKCVCGGPGSSEGGRGHSDSTFNGKRNTYFACWGSIYTTLLLKDTEHTTFFFLNQLKKLLKAKCTFSVKLLVSLWDPDFVGSFSVLL